MNLEDPIDQIKGVGEALSKKFHRLGLYTANDLISFYPRSYQDYSKITPIKQLQTGQYSVRGKISQVSSRYARRGLHITEAIVSDTTGSARIIWFNQPYRAKSLATNKTYLISGQFELRHQKFSMINPACELESDLPTNTARILPVYRQTKGLKSNQIRKIIRQVLPTIQKTEETLPDWIIKQERLVSRAKALYFIHYPKSSDEIEKAKQRLGFEEVFELSLAALSLKQDNSQLSAQQIQFKEQLAKNFVGHLPFQLTNDQRKVIWTIYQDLTQSKPMNRLLEGDVGSGKTVVATMAALMVLNQGYQVALMAPTEILAKQHADTIYNLLKPLGLHHKVGLLTGKMKASSKKHSHHHISSGDLQFIIGTHALIQEKVAIKKLGLIIIDEQHRFGVAQRKQLLSKADKMPHVLTMTATPIPRSLSLTLFGEMDVSIIKQKPKHQQTISTEISSPNSRASLYTKIKHQLSLGRQAFIVCPLVSDSDLQPDLQSATTLQKKLQSSDFKNYRVGLMHGKLSSEDKTKVMKQFLDKKIDVLVSTTVVEVGVDIPNANIMVIENADRFGLAQLHQLRGRVGRGQHQSYCYLIPTDSSAPSSRLRAVESTNDGFKLSELDLKLRGPGAIYGSAQHGVLDLSVANLSDLELVNRARVCAQQFIDKQENLLQYSHLSKRLEQLLKVTTLN